MKRFQAIEFEDYQWLPQFLKDYMTDFFHFQMDTFNLYGSAVEQLHILHSKYFNKDTILKENKR